MNLLHLLFGGASARVAAYLSLMRTLTSRNMHLGASLISKRLQIDHGVFISHKAAIPRSVKLRHPVGIVIGEGVILGERVIIYQNVTLGGARIGDSQRGHYPVVGDDTVIFAGAVLVGDITIGSGCTIGANAVVLTNVPSNSVAVGVPARIIPKEDNRHGHSEIN